jgi:anti-sigma regulatory factor (Ser/Thr protein kinase)
VPDVIVMETVVETPARVGAPPASTRPHPVPAPAPARIPAPRRPLDDAVWPLRHHPRAPQAARHAVRTALDAWNLDDDTADTVVLVVSELVTNAVEHAQAPLALHLHRDHGHGVWVAVSDGGPAPHEGPWTASCTPSEHGRGLTILDALTTSHGTRTHEHGTTHWAQLTP